MADEMSKLKFGIIGLSEGNGHPYSWAAIFNGYNLEKMKGCGFPVIPEYLEQQKYPNDFLSEIATVSHVWTQDIELSNRIAQAARIDNVSTHIEDMIGDVDGVLLARDDAARHLEMAIPLIDEGLPVFVDKPFALTTSDALMMLSRQVYEEQIFTCSSLRYANELLLSEDDRERIGTIEYVEGTVMKRWETYGIHLLEPLVVNLSDRGRLLSVDPVHTLGIHVVLVRWENCLANLVVTGNVPTELALTFYGTRAKLKKQFVDSFGCFKKSLETFVTQIQARKQMIPREDTLELVEIIDRGKC